METELLFQALRDNIEAIHKLAFAEERAGWEDEAALSRLMAATDLVSQMRDELEQCDLMLKAAANKILDF